MILKKKKKNCRNIVRFNIYIYIYILSLSSPIISKLKKILRLILLLLDPYPLELLGTI